MSPERKCTINGQKVEEFYWAGSYPVYVDNRATEGSYEEVCTRLQSGQLDDPTGTYPLKRWWPDATETVSRK